MSLSVSVAVAVSLSLSLSVSSGASAPVIASLRLATVRTTSTGLSSSSTDRYHCDIAVDASRQSLAVWIPNRAMIADHASAVFAVFAPFVPHAMAHSAKSIPASRDCRLPWGTPVSASAPIRFFPVSSSGSLNGKRSCRTGVPSVFRVFGTSTLPVATPTANNTAPWCGSDSTSSVSALHTFFTATSAVVHSESVIVFSFRCVGCPGRLYIGIQLCWVRGFPRQGCPDPCNLSHSVVVR